MDDEAFLAEATEVLKVTKALGVPLIINDNVRVCKLRVRRRRTYRAGGYESRYGEGNTRGR